MRIIPWCLASIYMFLGLELPSLQSPYFVRESKICQWATENDGKAYFHLLIPRAIYSSSWEESIIRDSNFINILWPEWLHYINSEYFLWAGIPIAHLGVDSSILWDQLPQGAATCTRTNWFHSHTSFAVKMAPCLYAMMCQIL